MNLMKQWKPSSDLKIEFDIAMNVNAMGALNVLNFSKRCRKMQPFKMGQTLKRGRELDIHPGLSFMKNRLQQLQALNDSS
ncbi:fatty acyl-CoA reductase 1-like [Prosopis cineraria]|uniref:fatty acyl-CoA reductase 1-like n=1 Tax=Prosopis cineraria TaxID=364024 RepID=UPI00241024C9|nr:fatty acyl-CoA reductase 1-like [Prosopis cineraria]